MSRYSYRHKKYDETIMQTKTVSNIVESLENGIKHRNLKEVAHFLIEKRTLSLYKADRRKANSNDRKTTVDSKVRRLKELGYEITKEGE
jgi:predicted ATPase